MKRMRTIPLFLGLTLLLVASTAVALEIEDVQKAILAEGADWTAGETAVSGLSPEQAASLCNLAVIFPEEAAPYLYTPESGKDMPPHLDWSDIDGKNFMTPVKDQHPCGTCATFSSVGAFEALFKVAMDNPFIIPDFSEQQVYSCAGFFPYTFFHPLGVLKDEGASDETCFPYDCDAPGDRPPCEDRCEDWFNRSYKIDNYNMMMFPNPEQMKAALQAGPIVSGFQAYEDFQYYTGGVYEHVTGGLLGGHGVIVAGYDDAGQYWICKNSWGTEWGEDGWFKIKWGDGLLSFGYQSFSIDVSQNTLCGEDLPPMISDLALLNESTELLEGEALLIGFAYDDIDADLAGGELWYVIDQLPEARYAAPLTQLTGTSGISSEKEVLAIPGPFGPGEHTIVVYVKDLCGLSSNELVAVFQVEGEVPDDDDDSGDDDSSDDDDDDNGFCG